MLDNKYNPMLDGPSAFAEDGFLRCAIHPVKSIPKGLKTPVLQAFCGTAKAVPFQNRFMR
jgi:hypothetical protein